MPDMEKVIKALEACTTKQTKCFANDDKLCPYFSVDILYCELELMRDALALLKEQEAVKPYIDIDEAKCPICKVKLTRQELLGDNVLFEDFYDYCPHCGKPVLWEGR